MAGRKWEKEKAERAVENRGKVRSIVLTGLFAATAVLLSGVHFPVGPIKAFPFQHMVNIVAGVLIGPWYAALSALIAAMIRNAMGTGTIFAFNPLTPYITRKIVSEY